jgi:hypothetical protein
MENTKNLKLPYIFASQAQKHVTHNESLRALDAIVHLAVAHKDYTAPPETPTDNERHIIGASATGDWTGKEGQVAAYQDGAWFYYAPNAGWLAWVESDNLLYAYDGTQWGVVSANNPTPMVGINGTADGYNRLLVNSAGSLLNHEGNGHQLKINKNTTGDTASLLFQNNYSGRAEFGLSGSDDFSVKTSVDGSAWVEALKITDGILQAPNRPYFRASCDGLQSFASDWDLLKFETSIDNTSGDYNTTTSMFTAPLTGAYLFSVFARMEGMTSGDWCRLFLQKNGGSDNLHYGSIIRDGGHLTSSEGLSFSIPLILTAGDTVGVYGGRGDGGSGTSGTLHQESHWTGVFLG